jgi:hypothetical protein
MTSQVHVLALLKGAVEGDEYKHFGSLLAIDAHFEVGRELGLLLKDAGGSIVPTVKGRSFYVDYGLRELPGGRANYWVTSPVAVAASRGLADMKTTRE